MDNNDDVNRDVAARMKKLSVIAVEVLGILLGGVVCYVISSEFDLLERLWNFSRLHEGWEVDEFVVVIIYFAFALLFFSVRRWHESRKYNRELRQAMDEIKRLRGIVPICSSCKKIRDDKGYWHQVEEYLRDHSEAEFTHGICPDCMQRLYPEFIADQKQTKS